MKKICLVLFIIFVGLTIYSQEVQIPITEKIEYLDAKIGQSLFPEYKNFKEARLFKISETSFVLEIYYQPEEKLLREKISLSNEEVEKFRLKVINFIKTQKPKILLDQKGRSKIIGSTMTLSLLYYGWAIPMILEVDDVKTAVALYMLISGAGFYIPFSITQNKTITDGEATFYSYGLTRGIIHGINVYSLFGDEESKNMLMFGMIGSLSEGISFFSLARKFNLKPGTVEVIGIGGDFGLFWSACISNLLNLKNREINGSLLLGSAAGLMTGKLLANKQFYTRGDALVLGETGFLGAYIPIAIVDMFDSKDDKAYWSASMLGSWVGLGLGHCLVKNKDFSTGQGTIICLGEIGGGLIGLGIGYLCSDKDNSTLLLTSSAIGSTLGFWQTYRLISPDAKITSQKSSWNIQLNPQALLALTINKKSNISIPIGMIEYRF